MGVGWQRLQLTFIPIALNKCVGKRAADTIVRKWLKAGCKQQVCSFQHVADCINKSVLKIIKSKYEY